MVNVGVGLTCIETVVLPEHPLLVTASEYTVVTEGETTTLLVFTGPGNGVQVYPVNAVVVLSVADFPAQIMAGELVPVTEREVTPINTVAEEVPQEFSPITV
jgi:hypothetical protein